MAYYNDENVIAPLGRFGRDPHSWNHTEEDDDDGLGLASDGSGYPGLGLLNQAIATWAGLQERSKVTLGEAAKAFFMTPELVRKVIAEGSQWTLWENTDAPLEEWVIGHDGD